MTDILHTEGTANPIAATIAPIVDTAKDVGAALAKIEGHAELIANHATDIENIKGDVSFIRTQTEQALQTATSLPETVRSEVTSTLESFKEELLTAAQSAQAPASGETTHAPEPVANRAAKKKTWLPDWMHRLV